MSELLGVSGLKSRNTFFTSTRVITDDDGYTTDKYAYDAYGAVIAHDEFTGSVSQPYQYVGRYGYYTNWQEPGLGLLQLGVRFYDPKIGRFLSRDPIGYEGGLNLYAYAYNRPITRIDPVGLKSDDVKNSCRGLNPNSCHGYKSCDQCCNALAADASVRNIIAVAIESGLPGPITVPDSILASCQFKCEDKCNKSPSGSMAAVNFAQCILPTITSDTIWNSIVQGLINILK